MEPTKDAQQYEDPEIPAGLNDPLGEMFSELLDAEAVSAVEPGEGGGTMELVPADPVPADPADEQPATFLIGNEEGEAARRPLSGSAEELAASEADQKADVDLEGLPAAPVEEQEPAMRLEPPLVSAPEQTLAPMEEPPAETRESLAAPAAAIEPAGNDDRPFGESNGLDTLVSEIDHEAQRGLDDDFFVGELQERASRGQQDSCIVFLLDGTRYAIPIRSVLEMDAMPRTTAVPNVPAFVRGVTNLRGEIVAVLDLRTLLGMDAMPAAERGRVLVVRTKDQQTAALAVDEVRGTTALIIDELAQPSNPILDSVAPILLGVGEHQSHVLNVLDVDRLFSTPALQQFAAV